ncbi:phage tail protein [Cellvibrio sp. UBA7671]|uniref:phage tail-collar fiber domain-containing protein n=1 Tax=Cellvibrio sp. UBA7671 TaxID=1946312 RepID=UPI002F35B06C
MAAAVINTGRAKIALKQANSEPLIISRFVFADIPGLDTAAPVDVAQGMPAPAHIVHEQLKTAQGYVAENKVVYSIILGATVGNFYFNWVGIVDEDDTLIGVSYTPRQYKYETAGLTTGNTITRNFLTQYNNASEITGITVPAETWQISFTDVLDNIDAALIADMRDLYGRSLFFNDAFRVVNAGGGNFLVKAGTAYVEGIRVRIGADEPMAGLALPIDFYVDVFRSGGFAGGESAYEIFTSAPGAPLADYNDPAGKPHYLVKVASISGAGVVTDHRIKRTVPGALIDTFATSAQGIKADTAIQPDQLKTHPDFIRLRRLALAGL